MKICSQCGYENGDGAKFCKNCGFKFPSLPESDNVQKVAESKNPDSIISKLFYKTDKYTGQLRFAKLKSITIMVFVVFFLLSIYVNWGQFPLITEILASILVGLTFAVPIFIIGYVLRWVIDRLYL